MASSDAWVFSAVVACGLSTACATSGAGHKSYVIPAAEIVAMDAVVNLAGRLVIGPATYQVTPGSIRRNLGGPWVIDDDPFEINQFLHPYQGAMYHGIARSNGLGYWPSAAYTFAGSALWEVAGETTPPSRNDQIASGIAGSFLGEPLFRISRLLIDRADRGPGAWRMFASILASPPAGINHAVWGDPAGSLRTTPCPSPTSASSSAQAQQQPAAHGSCRHWPSISRASRCRWITGIPGMPLTATSGPSITSGSRALSHLKESSGFRRTA